ncbi:hypothetical protein [Hymenobacter guriensis]|uniref:Uncharacterized protein n=1 Tax=Hymenobacter guriensis TaxID=2793065 RepID=A0ABS0L3T1_9BACT|nr:hypothetical protein [Hymenobacter guriensis]MBG8554595.1 hypothetical protein [Hymenobacter guriensis]
MEDTPTTAPQWIQDLQERSWELEFLISGGAIFTLIQGAGFFVTQVQSLKTTAWLPGTDFFLLFGVLAIQVLTLSFGLHLLLRSFWVALVCVTYLFPQGAALARVRWRRPFRAVAPSGSYFYELLLKLNRLCATVMFLAIISTLLLGGLMLTVVVLGTLPSLFASSGPDGWYDWYGEGFLILLMVYILDLLLFGALRRTWGIAWLLFPVFWLFDRVSLRVLLQPTLWLFVSRVSRWRMAGWLTVFMAVALIYSYAVIYQDLHLRNVLDRRDYRNALAPGPALQYGNYRDEMNGQLQRGPSIPSKFVDKPFLEVFLVYRKQYDADMLKSDSAKYLSDLVLISIDDTLRQDVAWYPTYNQANDQMGITAMVSVQKLKVGPHRLLLHSKGDSSRHSVIPFWKTE